MLPPPDVKTYENSGSIYWFESDGILCSFSKPDAPRVNDDDAVAEFERFYQEHGQRRFCILIDAKHAKPNTKAERQRAAEMLPRVTKALAVIVHNPLGRMLVNLFVGLQKPPYPLKIFKPGEEDQARAWLRQYLD